MNYEDKKPWAQLLIIVGGFILAETIIRSFLDIAQGNLAPWVLPLYAIAMIFGAFDLLNKDSNKPFSQWVYDIFIGVSILLIVLLKVNKINNILFLWLILIGSILTISSWIIEHFLKKKKK